MGYLGGRRQATTVPAPAHSSTTAPDTAGKVLYWYDPMAPEQHFDKPGLSPMGMEMVPRYADAGGAAGGVVRIDPATVQNLGVRTAPVERRVLARSEEHTSELQSLMRISYAVFCLKKNNIQEYIFNYRSHTLSSNTHSS